jgi:hypothetical protein
MRRFGARLLAEPDLECYLLDPHDQASQHVWVAPTSTHHRPRPRFLHVFAGARFLRADARISLVTAYSQCQARYGL